MATKTMEVIIQCVDFSQCSFVHENVPSFWNVESEARTGVRICTGTRVTLIPTYTRCDQGVRHQITLSPCLQLQGHCDWCALFRHPRVSRFEGAPKVRLSSSDRGRSSSSRGGGLDIRWSPIHVSIYIFPRMLVSGRLRRRYCSGGTRVSACSLMRR